MVLEGIPLDMLSLRPRQVKNKTTFNIYNKTSTLALEELVNKQRRNDRMSQSVVVDSIDSDRSGCNRMMQLTKVNQYQRRSGVLSFTEILG